jgi:hypothetical protein
MTSTSADKDPAELPVARIEELEAELVKLRSEFAKLRTQTQEHKSAILEIRGLGGRVSELADLVTELLVVAATRESPEFKHVVDKYIESI